MKVGMYSLNGTGGTLIQGQNDRLYIIHGYKIYGANDAGSTATDFNLIYWDYWTGKQINLGTMSLIASQVNSKEVQLMGLNLPTMPGTNVASSVNAAPVWTTFEVFYTEVLL